MAIRPAILWTIHVERSDGEKQSLDIDKVAVCIYRADLATQYN